MHKKYIYIIIMMILIFIIINNILLYTTYDSNGNIKNSIKKENISNIEKELNKYEKNSIEYIEILTKYEIIKIKNKYDINSWQYNKIEDYLYNDLYNINYIKYINNDNNNLDILKNNYDNKLKKLKNNDWKYFINEEINNKDNIINDLISSKTNIEDKLEIEKIDKKIEELNNEIKFLKYRIDNNIKYDNNYLNDSLTSYIRDINYKESKNSDYYKKLEYRKIVNDLNINKYIIDNKNNINKINTLNFGLRTILEDYELFIVIIIIITSSTIYAEEVQKGTIKLLMIKPYSRYKILLSKYLATIIIMILSIIILIILELLVGGLFLGYNTLSEKIVIYNYQKSSILCYNIFSYILIRIISRLPMLIILCTISLSLSIITDNSAISIGLSLLIYIFSISINNLVIKYNIWIMRYFITTNWVFTDYLFGGISNFKYTNFWLSIIICIIYYIIICLGTYKLFIDKEIKNV